MAIIKNKLKISKEFSLLLLLFVGIIVSMLVCMQIYDDSINKLCALLVLVYSGMLVYNYRKNIALFIMYLFIFYANWSIAIGVYIFPEIRPDVLYIQFTDISVYSIAIYFLLLFVITLCTFSLFDKKKFLNETMIRCDFNPNILIQILCGLLYVGIFAATFELNLGAQGGSHSALEEYKVFFLIIGSAFSRKNGKSRFFWTALVGATSILTLISGNRVTMLCTIIALAIMWYEEYLNSKRIILGAILVITIFTFIGATRGVYGSFSFQDGLDKLLNEKLTTDTFTHAFVPSLAAEHLGGVIPFSEKFQLFLKNIKYIFLGGEFGEYILTIFTKQAFYHSGGFIGATYFDFWINGFGGIISALLLYICIRLFPKNEEKNSLIVVAIVSFVGRWYVYNFLQLFRMLLFMIVLLFGFSVIKRIKINGK